MENNIGLVHLTFHKVFLEPWQILRLSTPMGIDHQSACVCLKHIHILDNIHKALGTRSQCLFMTERESHGGIQKKSGPSCSKLTMSLVNNSLKFTSSDTQIC